MPFQDLRGILQYVPLFEGKTFVVAADGAVFGEESVSTMLLDLATLLSLNIRVVLVHGAAAQVNELATERGVAISNDDGTGVTDSATLGLSLDAISRLGAQLMQQLSAVGLKAVTTNALKAHAAGIVGGIDLENTGRLDQVDSEALHSFLEGGMLPVVPPVGYDSEGRAYRLNSDEVATALAVALGAEKILYLSAQPPSEIVQGEQEHRQFRVGEAEKFVGNQEGKSDISRGLLSKLHHAARACHGGVSRVHILDGRHDEALLLELFSNEGAGVMVYGDEYLGIRKASKADIADLLSVMRSSMEEGQLLERSYAQMEEQIEDFSVLVVDGNVVACVALHLYENEGEEEKGLQAELACLFVKKDHENQGYGQAMVAHAEQKAKQFGASLVFALSTQSWRWFTEQVGYQDQSDFVLPPRREQARLQSERNAKVLLKNL